MESLPPVTSTGTGNFACRLNGKIWWPRGESGSDGVPLEAGRYERDGKIGFDVTARNIPASEMIGLNCFGVMGPGDYVLSPIDGLLIRGSADYRMVCGTLHLLRCDSVVAGTFEMTFASATDTVRLTYGRFDI